MGRNRSLRGFPSSEPCYDGPILEIQVGKGDKKRTIWVHQALIAPRSEFFERVVTFPWKEQAENLIKLPEDEPRTFAMYAHLLYRGWIPSKVRYDTMKGSEEEKVILALKLEAYRLAKLYVLCEKLQDSKSKNIIVDAFIQCTWQVRSGVLHITPLSAPTVNIIYEGTPDSSPMRSLLSDLYASFPDELFLRKERDNLPYDFLFDLSLAAAKDKKNVEELRNGSNYHEKSVRQGDFGGKRPYVEPAPWGKSAPRS